jgi:hypothetical protein
MNLYNILQILLFVYTGTYGDVRQVDVPTVNMEALRLQDFDEVEQKKMVYRAYGESRGDSDEAVETMIGTMICRYEQGYGTVDQLLMAYNAPDFPVNDELIVNHRDSHCQGYKYALSTHDTVYLGIPAGEPRLTIGDTHFFVRWVSNK